MVSGGKGKVGTKDGSKKQPTTRSAKAGLQFPGEEEEEEETHTRAPLCDFFSFFFSEETRNERCEDVTRTPMHIHSCEGRG